MSERSATTNQEQSFPVARSLEESSVSGIFEGRDVDKALFDFGEFILNEFIFLQTIGVKFRQELEPFFLFTFANEISWTLGHQTERHIDEDDYSSGTLQESRNPPSPIIRDGEESVTKPRRRRRTKVIRAQKQAARDRTKALPESVGWEYGGLHLPDERIQPEVEARPCP